VKDLSGLAFRSVRLNVDGSMADYGYHISTEMAMGIDGLYEGYGTFGIGESVTGTVGLFKIPFLRSGLIAENRTFFISRSALGVLGALNQNSLYAGMYPTTEQGVMFSGNFEMVDWAVAIQNGDDVQGDDYRFTGRLNFDLMGDGAGHYLEGAYNASEGTNLSAAVVGSDDGSLDKGTQFGLEVFLTTGPFSAWGEMVDYDETTPAFPDSTPWDLAATYMFTDLYEVGARFEDLDTDDNDQIITVGVNRYMSGHDVKWQFNWQSVQSDDPANEIDLFSLGLLVSF
jgi:hypothetical protein